MIPLRAQEGQHLEFKGRDALKHPSKIARAVVAMLNSGGGEIWIGVREVNGIAVQVEPIPDAERERTRLWNHVIDTIEPSPLGEEVRLDVVPMDGGGEVLCATVTPRTTRGPYALLKEGGRFFVVRVGDRTRAMTREEIRDALRTPVHATTAEEPLANAREAMTGVRQSLQKAGTPLFWIRLQPSRALRLDIHKPELKALLADATLTGNRPSGWSITNRYTVPRPKSDCVINGEEQYSGVASIHRDGAIEYRAPLTRLVHGVPTNASSRTIYPFALIELTVSLFRVAARIYADLGKLQDAARVKGSVRHTAEPDGEPAIQVLADVALIGLKDWQLRPYSPGTAGYLFAHRAKTFEDQDLIIGQSLEFEAAEIIVHPDACAFRLVLRVYEAFGLSEDEIPREFDRATHRLLLTE